MGTTKLGRGILRESSDKNTPWRADVKQAAQRYIENFGSSWEPYSCALSVRLVFTFWRPASVKRRVRPYPSVIPDLSKLARSTEDALTAAGIWKDDALIVEYTRLAKVYVSEDLEALDRPGCLIVIEEKPASVPVGNVRSLPELEVEHDQLAATLRGRGVLLDGPLALQGPRPPLEEVA